MSEESEPRRTLNTRSVLDQNREFFDQFFTGVVRDRFKVASDESAVRHMNILVGSCTACRCELKANSHSMILLGTQMSSTAPEILTSYIGPEGSQRNPLKETLRYQPPSGWINPENLQPVGDLTVWLDQNINSFLEWSKS